LRINSLLRWEIYWKQLVKWLIFSFFRPILEEKLLYTNEKNNAGAKPFDVELMLKIMLNKCYYSIED